MCAAFDTGKKTNKLTAFFSLLLFVLQALVPMGYMPAALSSGAYIQLCPHNASDELMAILHGDLHSQHTTHQTNKPQDSESIDKSQQHARHNSEHHLHQAHHESHQRSIHQEHHSAHQNHSLHSQHAIAASIDESLKIKLKSTADHQTHTDHINHSAQAEWSNDCSYGGASFSGDVTAHTILAESEQSRHYSFQTKIAQFVFAVANLKQQPRAPPA